MGVIPRRICLRCVGFEGLFLFHCIFPWLTVCMGSFVNRHGWTLWCFYSIYWNLFRVPYLKRKQMEVGTLIGSQCCPSVLLTVCQQDLFFIAHDRSHISILWSFHSCLFPRLSFWRKYGIHFRIYRTSKTAVSLILVAIQTITSKASLFISVVT